MPFSPRRFATMFQSRNATNSVQSVNSDFVAVDLTATPRRIADLLEDVGWHTRWGFATIEEAVNNVTAIMFYRPIAALQLRAASADAVPRPIPVDEDTYIPSAMVVGHFLSTATPGTYYIEVLHTVPTLFD